jgi:hypothetical protein
MSSYVIAAPEALAEASGDLTEIGEAIRAAAGAAAPSTTGIVAAAGDEVSAAITRIFGSFAEEFQALSAQTTLFHGQFVRALSEAAATYTAAEAANVSPLQALEQEAQSLLAPIEGLFGLPWLNGAGAWTGTVGLDIATLGAVFNSATRAIGLGGLVNFPTTVALTGPGIDGVTGVRIGFSFVQIPLGEASILGIPLGQISYPAPALWYFPTQANGSVQPNGTIYLQHGFAAIGWFYQPLGIQLAGSTDSVVVTPTVNSLLPLPFGASLNSPQMQQGVASLFLGNQTALNISASHAGFQGTLPQDFILSGHSAGGGLATLAAGDYLASLGTGADNLKGVVTFDGVANSSAAYAAAIASLQAAHTPVYVVAAPPQAWNAFGATTNELVSLTPPTNFAGVELVGGSHVDSMLGNKPVIDLVLQLVTQFSPPGNTQAVYTLSSGWINDIYTGHTPSTPLYGIYGPGPGYEYVSPGGQLIPLGQATGIVLP